jgi:hypothetical protein
MKTHPGIDLSDVIKAIYDDVRVNSLRAFDAALEAFVSVKGKGEEKEESKLLNLAARAVLQSIRFDGALDVQAPTECLFAPSMSTPDRKHVAVCLLRLLVAHPSITRQMDFIRHLGNLFDDVFEDTLYRIAKLSKSDQTFKKFEELRGLVFTVENDLSSTIESLAHLDGIGTFRTNYFKRLNAGATRVIVHPFLPENVREAQVRFLLSALEAYREQSGPVILDRFREVVRGLDSLRQAAEAVGTSYSRRFALKIADNAARIVTAHFDATPYSKSADVRVTPSEKKYPFQNVGAHVDLSVRVSNCGPGHAFDVSLALQGVGDEVEPLSRSLNLGGVDPSDLEVTFPLTVRSATDSIIVDVAFSWKNFDGMERREQAIFECFAQRSEVEWEKARTEDPYSLAPVSSLADLVGRTEIVNRLLSLTKNTNVGSAFIRGQKRVGKTSIVKALEGELRKLFPDDYSVIYLEAGDYICADAKETVNSLGRAVCRAVKLADRRFETLATPVFDGALASLNVFLQDAIGLVPAHRFVFVLDEFDELPLELYRRGLLGDAFFRTIRSISNKDEFGFILVGSEKMEYVLSCQGDALNKFTRIPVDYFDKENNWSDFQDLVKRPAKTYLDFSDPAVNSIYEASAGNPYFAKLICRSLFANMVMRRDCHVMPLEVNDSVRKSLSEVGANSFAHFWEDGIAEAAPRNEEISVQRRKVLLSLADCIRSGEGSTQSAICKAALAYGVGDEQASYELRDFERRQVFLRINNLYSCKVPLFSKWLVEKGYQEIVTSFVDRSALLNFKLQEERERVKDEEITSLAGSWGLYLGQPVTTEAVRRWLNQFKGVEKQRLMFKVLKGLRFYSAARIREKMREAHGIVTRQITWVRKPRQPKRRDLVVAALGGISHSGAEYARRYADENQIFPENVVPVDQIAEIVAKREETKGIVFVDDFVGTGKTMSEMLYKLSPETRAVLARESIAKFLVVVTGFTSAQSQLEEQIQRLNLDIVVHFCDPLDGSKMLFGNTSVVFTDVAERLQAKDCAYEYGIKLEPDLPLGYGECEAAIVFENKIPNNCLPILWSEAKGWNPLFRRT